MLNDYTCHEQSDEMQEKVNVGENLSVIIILAHVSLFFERYLEDWAEHYVQVPNQHDLD